MSTPSEILKQRLDNVPNGSDGVAILRVIADALIELLSWKENE